jgi:hypothetical protein
LLGRWCWRQCGQRDGRRRLRVNNDRGGRGGCGFRRRIVQHERCNRYCRDPKAQRRAYHPFNQRGRHFQQIAFRSCLVEASLDLHQTLFGVGCEGFQMCYTRFHASIIRRFAATVKGRAHLPQRIYLMCKFVARRQCLPSLPLTSSQPQTGNYPVSGPRCLGKSAAYFEYGTSGRSMAPCLRCTTRVRQW